jgi:hypothetical protein
MADEPFVSDIYYVEILERGASGKGLVTPLLFREDFDLQVIDLGRQDTLIIHFNHDLNNFSVKQPPGEFKTIIEKR